jgi:ABC-2 type transport system ATP-binding protein
MLEVNQLSKAFSGKDALSNVSFKVESGEIMCLLGANGAGKSTTINLCLGFFEPSNGEIKINNTTINFKDKKSLEQSKRNVVYIPEQVNLYQEFTAIENISYLASLSNISFTEQDVIAALEDTGLEQAAWKKPIKSYSKGMRQKVGIAFAIVRQAKVLLLDEPTSGLDPSATNEFIKIINKLAANGAAILMVTHDFYCANTLADKIGIMNKGKLIELLDNSQLSISSLEQIYHQSIQALPKAHCA